MCSIFYVWVCACDWMKQRYSRSHATLKLSFPGDVASSQQFADVFPSSHNTSPVFPWTPSFFVVCVSIFVQALNQSYSFATPLCTRLCLLMPVCVASVAERVMSWTRVCPHFDHLLEVKCCEWAKLLWVNFLLSQVSSSTLWEIFSVHRQSPLLILWSTNKFLGSTFILS